MSPADTDSTPESQLSDLDAAAERIEHLAPGYLERARFLSEKLSVPATPAERVSRALEVVDEKAQISPDAPNASPKAWGRAMKTVTGRLIRWYMIHMAHQVTDLGDSVSWLGRSLQEYMIGLEHEVEALRAEVAELRARVDRSG